MLKYTSYAIFDHQAADVMQPEVFVFILFHNDNDKFDVGRQQNVHDATTVNKPAFSPEIFGSLVHGLTCESLKRWVRIRLKRV